MKKVSSWTRSGFTLIELLIVVAIIAILAAIAVPNFLEAQTRSKVSRAKADMRSMATAVESYAVDNNGPPPGAFSFGTNCDCVGWQTNANNAHAQALLTTPIAYITDILDDPFKTKGVVNLGSDVANQGRLFKYDDYRIPSEHKAKNNAWTKCYRYGYTWSIFSVGPMRNTDGGIQGVLRPDTARTGSTETYWTYDPSNGTVSMGWIVRTNKGICTAPGN